ncbi:MAG: glycoside hydrolase family 13 protein [Aeromicrobium erythreum]
MSTTPWWRDAVIYQVYPRSWADADGDGVGDLPGITSRLDHLAALGVDALWLSPFYRSPQRDGGYDVADPRDVDPLFGTLADADALVERAHALGLRVVVDVVPNHTSDEHAWFRAALASPPGSPERARYVIRDGRGEHGEEPPNNWPSKFGGPAWTRLDARPDSWESRHATASGTARPAAEDGAPTPGSDVPDLAGPPACTTTHGNAPETARAETTGAPAGVPGSGRRKAQWYLHLFDESQPDLDWTNPEVHAELEDVLRFWLDRGVDGFRIDVAHGMVKAEGLPDADLSIDPNRDTTALLPMWDQPGVHDVYRSWRRLVDSYSGERMLCGEAWVSPPEALARYVRPDELHQTFNFDFLQTPWDPAALRESVAASLASAGSVGAPQTWVLSNHDVVRHATRLGRPDATEVVRTEGIGPDDPQPDAALGLRRARAATTLMLALPGSAYLYQGEELGLPDATELPDDVLQDPIWTRSGHTERGRDGCRVPVPWTAEGPSLGFGPGEAWLPQPPVYAELAPPRQDGVEGSTLELYRTLLRVRRERGLGHGTLEWTDPGRPDVLGLVVTTEGRSTTVLTSFSTGRVELPGDVPVLAASGPLDDGALPPDTTVWLEGAVAMPLAGVLG